MEKQRQSIAENAKNSASVSGEMQESMELFCRAMVKVAAEEKRRELKRSKASGGIDMIGMFFRILDNLKYVFLAALICAVAGGIFARGFSMPYYTATAKLYVLGQSESAVNLNSLQIGKALAMDYLEVFRTWEVHEMVREALGLECSYGEMQSMLTVTNPADTRLLYITVKNSDAQLATDIANAYAEAAKTFIMENMQGDVPEMFSVALVPGQVVSRSVVSYSVRGFLLGMVIAIGAIALMFVLDDRPENPEEVARIAGVPVLAVIPAAGKKSEAELKRKT